MLEVLKVVSVLEQRGYERKVGRDVRIWIKQGVGNHHPEFVSSLVKGPVWLL